MLKRIISLFLCFIMAVTMLPAHVIALETEDALAELAEPVVEETNPTEEIVVPKEAVTAPTELQPEPTEDPAMPTGSESGFAEESTTPTEVLTEPIAEDQPAQDEIVPTKGERIILEELERVPVLEDPSLGDCGEDAIWRYNAATKTLTISGSGTMTDYSSYDDTPWSLYRSFISTVIIEEGITSIGAYAFLSFQNITSVVIGEDVASIGEYAFSGCSGLPCVTLPAGLQSIGARAFEDCSGITEIKIPNGIENIGYRAFRNCVALTEITIPGTVSEISEDAFEFCEGLENVTLEEGVTVIGVNAFAACYDLKNISLPTSLESIGKGAFQACDNLQSIALPNGITDISSNVFAGCTALATVDLSESLRSIGEGAFAHCSSLTVIDIPGSVVSIASEAFRHCGSLESISIPDSVISIASKVFRDCGNLTEIVFEGDAPAFAEDAFAEIYSVVKYNAANATWTKDILQNYGGNIIWLPLGQSTSGTCGDKLTWEVDESYETLTISGSGAMYDYSAENPAPWTAFADYLHQINVQESEITSIGNYAFVDMDGISTVSLPGSVKCIGEGALSGNSLIQSFIIPESVTIIGKGAFADCTSLSQVNFPGNCPEILNPVFSDNMTLTAFYPAGDTSWTEMNRNSFGGNVSWYAKSEEGAVQGTCGDDLAWSFSANDGTITISGTGNMEDYAQESPAPWSGLGIFVKNLTIEDGVGSIGNYAFANLKQLGYTSDLNSSVNSVIIPASILSIGKNAFSGCVSMKKLVFLGDVPSAMADTIFSNDMILCAYYPYVNGTWSDEVRKNYGSSITWYGVAPNGREMGGTAGSSVYWCYDPPSATLTISGSGAIPSYAPAMEILKTPWSAWNGTIRKIVIETGITHIGDYAFPTLRRLQEVTMSDTVQSIGVMSFRYCTALEKLQLPGCVTKIGDYAFQNCAALTLHIPAGVSDIGKQAFGNIKTLTVDPSNKKYAAEDSLLLNKDKTTLFSYTVEQESYKIPDTVIQIYDEAFSGHPSLATVTIPKSVALIGYAAFMRCTYLAKVTIEGAPAEIGYGAFSDSNITNIYFKSDAPGYIYEAAFKNVTATAWYPIGNDTWTEETRRNYGGTITWESYSGVENRITIPAEELAGQTSAWIDGREYTVNTDGSMPSVDLPNGKAKTMVIYTYGESNGKPYPTGMKVWTLTNEDGIYTAQRVEELDDMLGYAGCSIRIDGTQGIRMITSIEEVDKDALTGNGLADYKLKEYGTAIAWTSQLGRNKPLVLGKSYVRHNYAYNKETGDDPIYDEHEGRMYYTNVLVGFELNQCKDDLAMRPYMILEDAKGNEITLYGGIVERSIGYIASEIQSKNLYAPESPEYKYLQTIIEASSEAN